MSAERNRVLSAETIEGGVRFCIEVTPSRMREWTADEITRFFDGIALVVAAAEREP